VEQWYSVNCHHTVTIPYHPSSSYGSSRNQQTNDNTIHLLQKEDRLFFTKITKHVNFTCISLFDVVSRKYTVQLTFERIRLHEDANSFHLFIFMFKISCQQFNSWFVKCLGCAGEPYYAYLVRKLESGQWLRHASQG